MSDTEEEVKLSREERLEAAKKKFEELKEKNKKKKKGKKKKKDAEEGVEVKGDESEVKEDESGVKVDESGVKEDENELKEAPESDREAPEAAQKPVEAAEQSQVDEPSQVDEESVAQEVEADDEPAIESKLDQEAEQNTDVDGLQEETVKPVETVETVDTVETTKEAEKLAEPAQPTTQESAPSWLETPDDGKSWLDEIQEQKPVEKGALETQSPASDTPTVESLQEIIASKDVEIKQLKDENTDLKMTKFDLLEQIETLQGQLKKLHAKLNVQKVDLPIYQSDYNSELSLSPEPPALLGNSGFIKTPSFQNFNEASTLHGNYMTSGADLRDRLMRWKDWQVDMRSWRSTVAGPIVEI